MDAFLGRTAQGFNPQVLLKFSDIDPRVQKHLARVYTTLTAALLVAAVGVAADVAFHIGGLLSTLTSFLAMFALLSTPNNRPNSNKRYGYLAAFAFANGATLGPLFSLALAVDPSIAVAATLGTAAVFASFSLSALLARRRSLLFLGGMLSSALLGLLALRLPALFFGRYAAALAFEAELYVGLLVFAGYVLLDTQVIVERASAGDFDSIRHALDLFVDFAAILARVMIILLKNRGSRERRRGEGDDEGRDRRRRR